jgi:hypothetical protein
VGTHLDKYIGSFEQRKKEGRRKETKEGKQRRQVMKKRKDGSQEEGKEGRRAVKGRDDPLNRESQVQVGVVRHAHTQI